MFLDGDQCGTRTDLAIVRLDADLPMQAVQWWKRGVVYEIYSRSFQDSNADGIGDLAGITRRLPHLVDLGVDAIWLSPIFTSPMRDFGYDISDYVGIDPIFGSLDDFDLLLRDAHERGLKVILDLVPNHTSDRHAWFRESRTSRASPKRDWYIWRDPAPGDGVPNNWLSEFGGSAWEYDAASGQYYYHAFLAAQPDLNWRNPLVRAAIYDVMRFWLRRGVDGFRVDVIWHLIKDDQFRDNPPNPAFHPDEPPHHAVLPRYTQDRPEMEGIVQEMRAVIDEFPDRVLIGEIYLPVDRLAAYYGRDLTGLHLPFNFSLLQAPWKAPTIAKLIDEYEAALPPGGWPNWVLGNHDRPRIASRVGPEQARVAGMLLLTLRGTPTVYYGDEIGMEEAILRADQVRDPFEKNVPGMGLGRDGCRTPMQWDDSRAAGFTAAEPWLPVSDSYPERNVARQREDASSIYQLYRRIIELRRAEPALATGAYRPLLSEGNLLLFARESGGARFIVALNMGGSPVKTQWPSGFAPGRVVLSTLLDRIDEPVRGTIELRPHEGLILAASEPA
jgi:alpha-glucosidase